MIYIYFNIVKSIYFIYILYRKPPLKRYIATGRDFRLMTGGREKRQLEREVEGYLVRQVERMGGMCPKFDSDGRTGSSCSPLVFWPGWRPRDRWAACSPPLSLWRTNSSGASDSWFIRCVHRKRLTCFWRAWPVCRRKGAGKQGSRNKGSP